ncbi:MAG: AAA family ATPase, partial [Candidatus Omnitrophota bacterium]|nr:AAA family ATPase [Candidatus Omnitrophota bacterium]
GLEPIRKTPRGLRLGGGAGKAVEWVVQMRRLPEARMLDRLVAGRRVGRRAMERLADRLIPFFNRAARGRTIDRYGAPRQVERLVLGNLRECRPFVGRLLSPADWRALEAAYRQYLALHEPLLSRRRREGRIIDGHGDLRCENICMTDPVSVFDCVEFEPAFRCGDLVNDFSFLPMDLEFRGRRDLAQALVARYRRRLSDPTFEQVLPFYQCHRSLVRAKVRALAWLQHPKTREGLRVRRLARRHFALARRYARAFAPPRLIVIGGLIGTGKSTLAKQLADALGGTWLRTDEIRLREFARLRAPRQGFAEGRYAPWVSAQVYDRLIGRAERLVRDGHSVVCDGMFSKAAGREELRRIARRHHAAFHFLECVAPRAVAVRRVARRYAGGRDLSEARPAHYKRLQAGFEPVRAWPAHAWTRLTTNRSPRQTCVAALEALRRAWVPA